MTAPLPAAGGPLLRILLVTGAYFPELSSGGLQCQTVARQLAGRVECRVLTTAIDPALPRHDVIDAVPVSRIAINVKSRASKARATFAMLAELLRLMPRVDAVHLHGVSSKNIAVTVVARLFRRPIVLSLHTARHDEPATVAAQGALAWWAYRAPAAYLAVSPGLEAQYRAAGLPADKVRQVPNGVDLNRFSPAAGEQRVALRRRLDLPVDQPIVLFVGLLAPDKQPRVLLDAWLALQRDAPASTVVFVGASSSKFFEVDGRLAAHLRAEADRSGFGDRVRFVEPTARVEDYFRAADVFVLSSAREGLPVALIEAMACGLPVIASRLPGATDVIIEPDVNGILVPPGDVAALTAALRRVLATPSLAAALAANARARALRDYGSARTADAWLDVYQQVTSAGAGRRANRS
jgi:glycosyltransferase involved in cell wall biosynthesis